MCCEHLCSNKHDDPERPGRVAAMCGACRRSARTINPNPKEPT
jgi:hypothetical protein